MNARRARQDLSPCGDHTAHVILVVSAIARERHRNEKVVVVLADKVQDDYIFLGVVFAQTAADLLHEDDRTLRGPQQDDLVDFGNVDAFVENVDREDVIKSFVSSLQSEASAGFFSSTLRVVTAQVNGTKTARIEFLREKASLFVGTAKDKSFEARPAVSVVVGLLENVIDAIVRHKL